MTEARKTKEGRWMKEERKTGRIRTVRDLKVYRKAFEGLRMGEAAAGGMVLLASSMLFTIFYLKVLGGEEESVW